MATPDLPEIDPAVHIAEIRRRIAQATTECDTWRSARWGEKYLEAYSLMESLEAELAALEDADGRARRLEASRSLREPCVTLHAGSTAQERERCMAAWSIAYDGVRYYYGDYRYDRLEDAVAYAKRERSRSPGGARMPAPAPPMVHGPDDDQRHRMVSAGVTYESGTYRLGEYRYDRVDDALAYASLARPA